MTSTVLRRTAVLALSAMVMVMSLTVVPPAQAAPTCFGERATIVGSPNDDDELTGTPNADVIVGLGGNDIIRGRGGSDLICGGSGQDSVSAGGGNDRVRGSEHARGGPGDDRMIASSQGFFTLMGGAGDDRLIARRSSGELDQSGAELFGGRGSDHLEGGSAPEHFWPGPGRDTIMGGHGESDTDYLVYARAKAPMTIDLAAGTAVGQGRDRASGIEGVIGSIYGDRIMGSGGLDVVLAGGGRDTVSGRAGNDHIDAGTGSDTVSGGRGSDTCLNAETASGCEHLE